MDFNLYDNGPAPGAGPFTGPETGLLESAGRGIMRGGVKFAKGAVLLASGLAEPEHRERQYNFIDTVLDPAEKFWSPDPASLTTAGKVVGGLAELPLQLVGGVPGIAMSITGNTGMEMVNQGVDPTTAGAVAAGVGVATTAMAGLPQAGNTLLKTAMLAALNPATGALTDYAARTALEAQGYEEQAKAFDPFDPAARSVDAVLGLVFGGVAHYGRWRVKAPTDVVDAIDRVELARQGDNLNPFDPAAPEAAAHPQALAAALDAVDAGRPVDVANHLAGAGKMIEPSYTAERFRTDVQEVFGLTDEHADATMALIEARAKVRGEDVDTFITRRIAGVEQGAPEGAALFQDRPLVQPFFSRLLAEVDGLKQDKWNAADLLNKLAKSPGVKGDEIAWTGLDEFLVGKKSVTRDEVRAFLQENGVRVEEVVKGERDVPAGWEITTTKGPTPVWRVVDETGVTVASGYPTEAELRADIPDIVAQRGASLDNSRYGGYVLPNGENYRELLLTLPGGEYRAGHFEERGILAHVRFNERTGPAGELVLHLEEIQSDWHQARRAGKDVPDAPFEKTWPELAFKRMLRWAAEHGFDRITWTTGEQQAARYDLSKVMDSVTYQREGTIYDIKGMTVKGVKHEFGTFNESDLADAVGKELAAKMKADKRKSATYDNLELKLGGEGMAGFYDQIVPNIANALGKKFDARVADVATDAGTLHSLPITDRMKESLLYEGQPLFQGEKGAVSFLADGRAVIHALEAPDVSTLLHELGHVMEKDLTPAERREFDTWLHSQVPGNKWSTAQREHFARAFERYLAEGKAPTEELRGVFDKFKDWLLSIYQRIAGTAIDVKMSDKVRATFDRLLFDASLKKEPAPEVRPVRAAVDAARVDFERELVDTWGAPARNEERGTRNEDLQNLEPRTSNLEPAPVLHPIGTPADVLNNFAKDPTRISPFLADSLNAEAQALEAATSGKVVIDGHAKQATWSDAAPWFIGRNRELRDGGNGMSKQSVISALRKTAAGKYADLTPGQQDMVLSAMEHITRMVDAHAHEIGAAELQPGDRFTTTGLEARTVAGLRDGRVILDNGEVIPGDRRLRVIGEVDSTGRAAAQPKSAAEIILAERGDFEIFDGIGADGTERLRSATELLNEARDAVAVEQNRAHLYQRAAVCLNLG